MGVYLVLGGVLSPRGRTWFWGVSALGGVCSGGCCRMMKMKGMVFRYMWVYSKEDTMAHTRRPVVTS